MTSPTQPTVAERDPVLVFELSNHELTFLLRLLGAQGMLGYVPEETLDAQTNAILTDVLRARGFLVPNEDGELVIRTGLDAILAAGALFGGAISLQVVDDAGVTTQHWFYLNREVVVYHTAPQARVQRFVTVPDALALASLIANIMGIDPNRLEKPTLAPINIALGDWQHIVEMNRDNRQAELAEVLRGAGMSEQVVTALTQTGRRSVLTLLLPREGEQVESHSLLLFTAPNGYWLLVPEGEVMTMQPANARDVLDKLVEFLNHR
ncbi:MAG: hypothetical protein OHK0023_08260 [Anaerolineae bacterium]